MRKLLLIKKKINEEIRMSIRQGAFIREGRLTQSVVGEGFYYRRDRGYYSIKVTGVLVGKF